MKKLVFLVWISVIGQFLTGQDEGTGKVPFTPDFRFNDGIFVVFEQVLDNNPIPKSKILTSSNYNDRDFFRNVFDNDKVYYYDDIGIRQEIEKKDIFGYSRNGILYVQVEGTFNRITFVGSLCHFVADITSYDRRYYNSPYNYYDPYYNPYSYSNYYSPYYSPYSSPYYMPYRPTTVAKNELVQYIFDMETGQFIEYDIKNVEMLLMKDPELHQEFMSLSRKKKKQMLFLFIRKYNEKHPFYLPKN